MLIFLLKMFSYAKIRFVIVILILGEVRGDTYLVKSQRKRKKVKEVRKYSLASIWYMRSF